MSERGRTMLGARQREWLSGELDTSRAAWRIVATALDLHAHVVRGSRRAAAHGAGEAEADRRGREGQDHDQWDGYPAERALLTGHLREKLGLAPRDPRIVSSEEAYVAAHEHVQWCEIASHGYVVIDVDGERLRGEWWHVDTVLEPSRGVSLAAAFEAPRGEPRLRSGDAFAVHA